MPNQANKLVPIFSVSTATGHVTREIEKIKYILLLFFCATSIPSSLLLNRKFLALPIPERVNRARHGISGYLDVKKKSKARREYSSGR